MLGHEESWPSQANEVYGLFLRYIDVTPELLAREKPRWWTDCSDISCVGSILSAVAMPYHESPWQLRFNAAMAMGFWTLQPNPDIILMQISCEIDDPRLLRSTDDQRRSMLHLIAHICGNSRSWHGNYKTWSGIAIAIITQDADLHSQDQYGETPLMCALSSANDNCPVNVDEVVRRWLSLLASANVDLDEYGRLEVRIWKESCTPPWIQSFTYGPCPEDS